MDIKENQLLRFIDILIKNHNESDIHSLSSTNKENIQLAKELNKPIIRKFKKRTVYSKFKDNIWGADLADMQLLSKFNKGFRFLLCVIDTYKKVQLLLMHFKKY